MVSVGATTAGCPFPPGLNPSGADAGPSSPPVILSAGPAPEFSFPGPMVLDRQDARTLSLTVQDADTDDVIHVKLFVDYGRPDVSPAWATCQAASTGELSRVVACPVNTVCNAIAETDPAQHVLEAMVADREFIDDDDDGAEGQPPFRALEDIERAAFSFGSWTMTCSPPGDS